MTTLEARRMEAWKKVPNELTDKLEQCRLAAVEASKPYEEISDQIMGIVDSDKLDPTDETQKALFLEQSALYIPLKIAIEAHLAALGACWDYVGGDIEE